MTTLPQSNSTVSLSIIDTGTRMSNISTSIFMEPEISAYPTLTEAPAFSFLIEHPTRGDYIFDLGIRKDTENQPGWGKTEEMGWQIEIPKDPAGLLSENGFDLESVKGIIWSHPHLDHVGDPSTFPSSTDLIVGPGFKANYFPGWPTNPNSQINEDAFKSRKLVEIDFNTSQSIRIAGLRAYDMFKDGSFYLLDAPGHTIGHMMGLARTTPDSFILLGGDACHHAGHFRPTESAPVPESVCPGDALSQIHPHPENATTTPFYTYPNIPDGTGIHHNRADALASREGLMLLDAEPSVWTVIAHDPTVLKGKNVKIYPEKANAWKEEGWKEDVKWLFLKDFKN